MTLRLVSKPVNGGGDFGPPPTVPKESVGGKERERERERLDASPGPAFPAPGQVNPLSSNIETNYRSPALVIIRLQINAFKLSAFEITVLDSSAARKYAADYASFRFPSFLSHSLIFATGRPVFHGKFNGKSTRDDSSSKIQRATIHFRIEERGGGTSAQRKSRGLAWWKHDAKLSV